jgi:hypothetical protein
LVAGRAPQIAAEASPAQFRDHVEPSEGGGDAPASHPPEDSNAATGRIGERDVVDGPATKV